MGTTFQINPNIFLITISNPLKSKVMNIILKDTIHPELKSLGLKPGDVNSNATIVSKETGSIQFTKTYNCISVNCSIWPEDYEIIPNQSQTIEAAVLAGFEPSDVILQDDDQIFIEAQEYLSNEAIRY